MLEARKNMVQPTEAEMDFAAARCTSILLLYLFPSHAILSPSLSTLFAFLSLRLRSSLGPDSLTHLSPPRSHTFPSQSTALPPASSPTTKRSLKLSSRRKVCPL
jgi:hypothetical protein